MTIDLVPSGEGIELRTTVLHAPKPFMKYAILRAARAITAQTAATVMTIRQARLSVVDSIPLRTGQIEIGPDQPRSPQRREDATLLWRFARDHGCSQSSDHIQKHIEYP